MERHTPDNHPSSEEKRPSPRHSDRGRAKNIENIGDSMRWRTGRPSPGNASEDPEKLSVSESTQNSESGWAWTENPPGRCSSP